LKWGDIDVLLKTAKVKRLTPNLFLFGRGTNTFRHMHFGGKLMGFLVIWGLRRLRTLMSAGLGALCCTAQAGMFEDARSMDPTPIDIEMAGAHYRIPRNYLFEMDDWRGGPQKQVSLRVFYLASSRSGRIQRTATMLAAEFMKWSWLTDLRLPKKASAIGKLTHRKKKQGPMGLNCMSAVQKKRVLNIIGRWSMGSQ
jgi:hypothetical protein